MRLTKRKVLSLFLLVAVLLVSMVPSAFATTNPVTWSPNDKGSNVTLSNGNLTALIGSPHAVRATKSVSSGKWYWEVTIDSDSNSSAALIGIANASADMTNTDIFNASNTRSYYTGYKYPGGAAYGSSFAKGDVIGVALDMDNGTITFYKNGSSQGMAFTDVLSCGTTIYPFSGSGSNVKITANFGATPFSYTVPDGYQALDSSIPDAIPDLSAIAGNAQVTLSLTAVNGATSYNIKRATTTGGPYTQIGTSTTNSYTDSTVTNGTTYYYVVTAVNSSGESANSNEASATPIVSGRALLVVTMINGTEKEYDLTMTQVTAFINWYDGRAEGSGSNYYIMNKNFNLGPFQSRKDYLVFDKIMNFEVMEYQEQEQE